MIAAALALVVLASADGMKTAPAQGPLSWEQANSLTRKLEAIEKRKLQPGKKRETVFFTQGEVNSYLNLSYAERLPKGVSDVEVKLDRERMQVKGLVNIDRVKGKVEGGGGGLLSFLSGDVPLEATGKVRGRDGFGTVVWESVYLGGMRVPISALEQMVRSATKTEEQPDGFDIHAPFRLPHSVNGLRLEPGRAILDF